MVSPFDRPFLRSGGDPLVSIYREINRVFDDVLGGSLGAGVRQPGALMPAPLLDIQEKDHAVCISVELPGVKGSDVDVRLEGDTLTISGEKKSEHAQRQGSYHLMERSFGRFSRAMQLPFRPDPDAVRADFEDGVLTVRLVRAPQQGSRRIIVRSGSDAAQASPDASAAPGSSGVSGSPGSPGSSGVSGAPGAPGVPGVPGVSDATAAREAQSGGGTASAEQRPPGGFPDAAPSSAQPAPRNDEAGHGVVAGAAQERGLGGDESGGSPGGMGGTGTEAAASRSVGP